MMSKMSPKSWDGVTEIFARQSLYQDTATIHLLRSDLIRVVMLTTRSGTPPAISS